MTWDNEDKCLNCDNKMINEGKIQDDLQLCHGCYSNETLQKYYGVGMSILDELEMLAQKILSYDLRSKQ